MIWYLQQKNILYHNVITFARNNKVEFNMCQKPYSYEKMKRIYGMQGILRSLSFLAYNVLMDDFAYCKHILDLIDTSCKLCQGQQWIGLGSKTNVIWSSKLDSLINNKSNDIFRLSFWYCWNWWSIKCDHKNDFLSSINNYVIN